MQKFVARLFVFAFCMVISACTMRPTGLMTPAAIVTPPIGADKVELLVVTNRAPSKSKAHLYSGIRGEGNEFSNVKISIPPAENRKTGKIQWPKTRKPNLDKDFATISADSMNDAEVQKWFSAKSIEYDGNFLIFVHGFNTAYDSGIYLLAQITHDSRMDDAPILFSWPSRGNIMSYDYDRESATYSRTSLANLIEQAANQPEVKNITIFAHSMGSWLTMESLRTLKLRDGKIPDKISNVILASPDIDVMVFRSQYEDLGAKSPPITLLTSHNDEALKVSKMIGGNINRVGLLDFTKEPFKSAINKENIKVIDVSSVKGGGVSDHFKFSESPEIVRLIGESLINGQKLSEDEKSFYDQLGILITGGAKEIVRGVGKTQHRKK